MTRVFIVARSPATRSALRDRCVAAGLMVVGEGADWLDAPANETDVIVGPNEDEVTSIEVSGDPTEPAIMLVSDQPEALRNAVSTGAKGWGTVPETTTADELGAAVNAVAHGLAVAPASLMTEVMAGTSDPRVLDRAGEDATSGDSGFLQEPLTTREREVLELVGQGHSNRGIADALGISDHTVKFHLASIYGKLGVSTRTGAVRRGLRRGLITI